MRDEISIAALAVWLCTTSIGCSCGSDDSSEGTSGGAAGAAGASSGGSGGSGGLGGSGGASGAGGESGSGGAAGASGSVGAAGAAGASGAAGADAGVDAGPASLTLVTFDATRGGDMAGATGVPFGDTRVVLEAEFALTWQEVDSLTALATSTADGVLISPVFGASSGITPLSTAEQTALLDFAKAGHFVVLLTENDVSFDAASDSLLAPFGLSAQGTIQGDTTGTATVAHPITTGWSTVTLGWPGSTPSPDAGAQVIATSPLGPYILVFESGALGSGSGAVVIITDASPYYSGWTGANSPEALIILKNALHHASGK